MIKHTRSGIGAVDFQPMNKQELHRHFLHLFDNLSDEQLKALYSIVSASHCCGRTHELGKWDRLTDAQDIRHQRNMDIYNSAVLAVATIYTDR